VSTRVLDPEIERSITWGELCRGSPSFRRADLFPRLFIQRRLVQGFAIKNFERRMRQRTVIAILIAASFVVSERPAISQDQPSEEVTPPIKSPSDVSPQAAPIGDSQERKGEPLATPADQPAGNSDQGTHPKTDATPQGSTNRRLPSSFKVRFTYSEKLAVPRGSKLTVTISDGKGHKVTQLSSSTKQDNPPYLLEIPIKKAKAYPLTLDAELISRIGHRFSKRITLDESSSLGDVPIEVNLQKK
jgi:hypothetical protein